MIVLGLGFTGKRVARRLVARGERVFAAVRGIERFGDLERAGVLLAEMDLARASIFPHLPG